VLALAGKIRYAVQSQRRVSRNFTGHLHATLNDGSQRELRHPTCAAARNAPLVTAELESKFMDNAVFGGWCRATAERLLRVSADLFSYPRLDPIAEFRT